MNVPWVERYRPSSRNGLVGNLAAIDGLMHFLRTWTTKSKVKAAILLGPAGCGKTSSVYALANDLGYTVMEVNASDTRKKASIIEILEPATRFSSLFDEDSKRIILMDEVDGLSGTHDRGGLNEFIKVLQNTRYPIIGTANDPESANIVKLLKRKEVRAFRFTRLSEAEIFELLLNITEQQKVDVSEQVLDQLSTLSAGDIRAAINELESHVYGSSEVHVEQRDKMRTLVELLNDLFRAKDFKAARRVLSNAPSDYYRLLLYLFDESVHQCKTPKEVAAVYDQLANADLVYNRIMRTQNWSLLKYFFDYIGPALNIARSEKHFKKIQKLPNIPSSFMARGRSKSYNSSALSLAPTVAPRLHISRNKFIHQEYRYFEKIILGENGSEIAADLNLSDDHISALAKNHPTTKLEDEIEEARSKIGKIRAERGKLETSTIEGLDLFFGDHKVEEQDDEIEEEPEEKGSQLSLDDFF
ncbi:MAG: replication factor C large subunit [Candidatus Kariarchaeaceae archaeon]|jgi:replication factor C large subunit